MRYIRDDKEERGCGGRRERSMICCWLIECYLCVFARHTKNRYCQHSTFFFFALLLMLHLIFVFYIVFNSDIWLLSNLEVTFLLFCVWYLFYIIISHVSKENWNCTTAFISKYITKCIVALLWILSVEPKSEESPAKWGVHQCR